MAPIVAAVELAREAVEKDLADSIVVAEVAGVADVAAGIPDSPSTLPGTEAAPPLPPSEPIPRGVLFPRRRRISFPIVEDALTVLDAAPAFTGATFQETAAAAQQGAFAITTDLAVDTVEKIRDELVNSIAQGHPKSTFLSNVRALMDEGAGLSEARLSMVFRNTVGSAFSDAAERSLATPLVVDFFPFRAYFATSDTRVREEHLALETLGLDGTNIYWSEDPVWKLFRPPWDWGCRCSFSPVTVQQAARKGVSAAIDWLDRAKAIAAESGDSFAAHLQETRPLSPPLVTPPDFRPDPTFRRLI